MKGGHQIPTEAGGKIVLLGWAFFKAFLVVAASWARWARRARPSLRTHFLLISNEINLVASQQRQQKGSYLELAIVGGQRRLEEKFVLLAGVSAPLTQQVKRAVFLGVCSCESTAATSVGSDRRENGRKEAGPRSAG